MRESNVLEKGQKRKDYTVKLTSQEHHFVPFPLEALSSAENLHKNPHQRLATNLKEKEGQQVRVIYILLVVSELSWVFKKVSKEPRMLVAGGNWREAWG